MMNFYTVRDLRTAPKNIWDSLAADSEVIITNNGKPSALILDISKGNLEETLKAFRQARAMLALTAVRKKVADANAYMTEAEIEAEIAAYREEKRNAGSH